MPSLLDNIQVGDALQQLADRLAAAKVLGPAVQLLRDTEAHAEVDPGACATLPQVNALWCLSGTHPLASLLRPEPDHRALAKVWDGAMRCYLSGKTTSSLTRALNDAPRGITRWFLALTGLYPYRLSRDPGAALLAVSSFYANDPWCYHDDGVEFLSPTTGSVVRMQGENATNFDGVPRTSVKEWIAADRATKVRHLPAVTTGSTLRALLEQALFVDDLHTLRIAHLLELAGFDALAVADGLENTRPRPPQEPPTDVVRARPHPAYLTVQELLGIGYDVPATRLIDQLDMSMLMTGDAEAQAVRVAEIYKHVVEAHRMETTGRFVAHYSRTVPKDMWLEPVEVTPKVLRRWLQKPHNE